MTTLSRPAVFQRALATLLLLLILAPAVAQSPPDNTLRVMTFNLRYASDKKPNSWPERRPVVRACLEETAPDIVGTQEGLYPQLKDIAADLPAYHWIGLGRDGGSHGEFMAIFYRHSRFTPLEYDHFWLSDNPSLIASTNWGNTNRRMATWIRFHDRQANREFIVFNTHLDHAVRLAREKGAALIRERVAALDSTGLPILLLGDFNAEPGREKTHESLLEGGFFSDTHTTAKTRRNEGVNTFHNFNGPKNGAFRIDWILARGPWQCDASETILFQREGQYPSDHFPVMAWLRLP